MFVFVALCISPVSVGFSTCCLCSICLSVCLFLFVVFWGFSVKGHMRLSNPSLVLFVLLPTLGAGDGVPTVLGGVEAPRPRSRQVGTARDKMRHFSSLVQYLSSYFG